MNAGPPVQFIPYGADLFEAAAAQITRRFSHQLPDLTRVIVLLPGGCAGRGLRSHLLKRASAAGCNALLGPTIDELRRWVEQTGPPDQAVPGARAGELMLVEAMLEHPRLFGAGNPWTMAASLIDLFDELTLHQVAPAPSLEEFTRRLSSAYGLQRPAAAPLTQEAALVYTLWQAWHEQLRAEGSTDRQEAYLHRLAAAPSRVPGDAHFFFLGHYRLLPAEAAFVDELTAGGRATVILQGQPGGHPLAKRMPRAAYPGRPEGRHVDFHAGDVGGAYAAFLDQVYLHAATGGTQSPAASMDTAARARAFEARCPNSPADSRLFIFEARSPEDEARAVDLQVRRRLLEGRSRIAIVTGDRRLARRVRARLERAGVTLRDAAGWALSTTSAAAALERWLETLEEDFHYVPLLDLLRSPFVLPGWDRERLRATVYRLEQDVIIHENVAQGLTRYRSALASRRRRLATSEAADVRALLDALEEAAAPVLPHVKGRRQAPARLLHALCASAQRLGMDYAFAADAAGEQVLHVMRQLRQSFVNRRIEMNWTEFRGWLGRALEGGHFIPAPAASTVELLSPDQATLGRYDALIIAALDRNHLPGDERAAPFFNNAVRRELGLASSQEKRHEKLHQFRTLLEAAPWITLTVCVDRDGEPVAPSPWLELLQSFHQLAYGRRLFDDDVGRLIRLPATEVVRRHAAPPRPRTRPAPRVDHRLIPGMITATSHQQLVDCPYQFFAARCLGLAPPEPVTEKLRKSDYGERVHRILQAFHAPLPGLPGPFGEAVTEHNRDRAVALLGAISKAVFARDLEDNFLHRGWLHRWQAVIGDYVDWQIGRAEEWQVTDVEINAVTERFSELSGIKGRLDRIDTGPAGTSIIDYKTGAVPGDEDVQSGEAVQLPFYALLTDVPPARVEYLCLDKNRFGTRARLEGENLLALRDETARRLKTVVAQLHQGAALPAWGDERTCDRCRMGGLCRKQAWETERA